LSATQIRVGAGACFSLFKPHSSSQPGLRPRANKAATVKTIIQFTLSQTQAHTRPADRATPSSPAHLDLTLARSPGQLISDYLISLTTTGARSHWSQVCICRHRSDLKGRTRRRQQTRSEQVPRIGRRLQSASQPNNRDAHEQAQISSQELQPTGARDRNRAIPSNRNCHHNRVAAATA
jgi:hypothetical protein